MKRILYGAAGIVVIFMIWSTWFRVNITNPVPTGTHIIAFGDSLTAGVGASAGEDYPSQLSRMIGRDIINKGVPGETTEHALRRLDQDVLALDPQIVIVFLGGNDLLQRLPVTSTFQNLEEIVRRIQEKGALVILVGLKGIMFADNYSGEYKTLARKRGAVLVPNSLKGIIDNPKLKSDQVHPNGAGYTIIAERVHAAIKPYL